MHPCTAVKTFLKHRPDPFPKHYTETATDRSVNGSQNSYNNFVDGNAYAGELAAKAGHRKKEVVE